MNFNTGKSLASIKASSVEGAKAGLTIGAFAGVATKLVGRRVPLFNGRFRQYDLASHVIAGGLTFCAMGAMMAGRDIFHYFVDFAQREPQVDAEIHAAERAINNVTGYRATILQNQAEVIARWDEAFEARQAAIRRFHETNNRPNNNNSSTSFKSL